MRTFIQNRERHGFVRVAACSPRLRVADCVFNTDEMLKVLSQAQAVGTDMIVFPELALTGYSCDVLFHQKALQDAALRELLRFSADSKALFQGLIVVGVPLVVDNKLFNCAAVINDGKILGIVPKTFLPTNGEFNEGKYFASAAAAVSDTVRLENGTVVPFSTKLLFQCTNVREFVVGVEICEDGWVPRPPSSYQCEAGATVLVNLSASDAVINKAGYRRMLFAAQSGRCIASYVYAPAGPTESTNDVVFDGHSFIAENGSILAEAKRYQQETTLTIADVDVEALVRDRIGTTSFNDAGGNLQDREHLRSYTRVDFSVQDVREERPLLRSINAHPFVPSDTAELNERCEEVINIKVAGLVKRLGNVFERTGNYDTVIGVSGGRDSTLELLTLVRAYDLLGVPRTHIKGLTMPGFGTTSATKGIAWGLMNGYGISSREIDIKLMCLQEMRALGHKPFGIDLVALYEQAQAAVTQSSLAIASARAEDLDVQARWVNLFMDRLRQLPPNSQDLVFENIQARTRTKLLMASGFVVGTGDMSEGAVGWSTYNGDHMSMYNSNSGVPKTLVNFLIAWAAKNLFDGEIRKHLLDCVAQEISPELLPLTSDGKIQQKTEVVLGKYELLDFFLYYLVRWGAHPEKILYLAGQAKFDTEYGTDEIRKRLKQFLTRFFIAQFKRTCVPNGVKVGSVCLSPRGEFRMPSDAEVAVWLEWADESAYVYPHKRGFGGIIYATTTRVSLMPKARSIGPVQIYLPAFTVNRPLRRALGIIDAANDFGGPEHLDPQGQPPTMAVPGGHEIGPVIGHLQDTTTIYAYQFAGDDYHPHDMFNFASQNVGKTPFVDKAVDRDGQEVTIYPDHNRVGTWGAQHLKGVREDLIDEVFHKGDERDKDSYSACGNPNLVRRLREQSITHVDLVGLVLSICVAMTALDLVKAGFKVRIITDATRDLAASPFAHLVEEMRSNPAIEFTTSADVLRAR